MANIRVLTSILYDYNIIYIIIIISNNRVLPKPWMMVLLVSVPVHKNIGNFDPSSGPVDRVFKNNEII